MLDDFRFTRTFRVIVADTDFLGHANNVAYIRWCEVGRCEYFHEVICGEFHGSQGFIVAKVDFTFERQLRYHEEISVGTRVSRIGGKSFDLTHEVWSVVENRRCGYGVIPLVAYDYHAQKTIRVPDAWRTRILDFERVSPTYNSGRFEV